MVGEALKTHSHHLLRHYRRAGWRGMLFWVSKQSHRIATVSSSGDLIWEDDWDLLIILDACRPEWLREVSSEYGFLPPVSEQSVRRSVGGASPDWYEKTFNKASPNQLKDLGVITANSFANKHVPDAVNPFLDLEKWAFDEDLGVVPAHIVTDEAIRVGRDIQKGQYIVHYLQPHIPFLKRQGERCNIGLQRTDVQHRESGYIFNIAAGREPLEQAVKHFKDNLRYVLDEVEILLNNFEANNTVITADHGTALGERFIYGHKQGVDIDAIRRVPWVVTEASDYGTHQPPQYEATTETSREERLAALGYR